MKVMTAATLFVAMVIAASGLTFAAEPIRALYVPSGVFSSSRKIAAIEDLLRRYEPNGVVINIKDDSGFVLLDGPNKRFIAHFKDMGAKVVCRLVVFKDDLWARAQPEQAVRSRRTGKLWRDGGGSSWADQSGGSFQDYIILVSLRGRDAGCDEINYDYIRFTVDGDTEDMAYPFWNSALQSEREAIQKFLARLEREVTGINLSAAVFGFSFLDGKQERIGQNLMDFARYLGRAAPMAYPSHYDCGAFGLDDPNKFPYVVYKRTLEGGLKYLRQNGGIKLVEVRPYIQAFSIKNIYFDRKKSGCVKRGIRVERVEYGRTLFREQIRAIKDAGFEGWMAWNPHGEYSPTLFDKK